LRSLHIIPAVLAFAALVLHADSSILHHLWQAPACLGLDFPLRWTRDILTPLLLASAVMGMSWLLGRRLLAYLAVPAGDLLAGVEAAALGAGAWASVLLWLGLCGAFSAWPIAIASAALAAFSVYRAAPPDLAGRRGEGSSWSWLQALLSGVILFALWHGLLCALAPATDMDVLTYHLPLPKHYLAQGSIRAMPWLLYSLWPHLINVFYALALLLRQDSAAALLGLAAYALMAVAVWRVGRQWFDVPTAWLACALLVVQPVFARFAGTARIDGWWALFDLLACASVWSWTQAGIAAWLIRGGLLAGLGASTKLLGAGPLLALSAWVFLQKREAGLFGRRAKAAGLFLLCGAAPCLIWFVKNWIEIGDPLWPSALRIFRGQPGIEAAAPFFAAFSRWPAPLTLDSLLRYQPQYILIPLAVGLIGAGVGRGRSRLPPFLKFCFWIFLPYALAIARNWQAWRYCLPFLGFMALAAGWGLSQLARRNWAGRVLAAAALCVGLYPALLLSQNNELFAVLSLRSQAFPDRPAREVYLARSLDTYSFVQRANALLGPQRCPDCRVLLFPSSIDYYWDADIREAQPFSQGVLTYGLLADSEALGRRLRELGVTHVFVDRRWLALFDQHALDLMSGFLSRHGRPLLKEDSLTLWAIEPASS
jgi:hypothetical protein